MKKVFICHLSEDKEIVLEIRKKLMDNNVQPWVDSEDLLAGEIWKEKIEREIGTADAVLVCLSKKAYEKESFFHHEIQFALNRANVMPPGKKFIIPLVLEKGCDIHPYLEIYHHIKIWEGNWLKKLLKSLNVEKSNQEIESEKKLPIINEFTASKTFAEKGEEVTFYYAVTNAELPLKIMRSFDDGTCNTEYEIREGLIGAWTDLSVEQSATYTLVASNVNGEANKNIHIVVIEPESHSSHMDTPFTS